MKHMARGVRRHQRGAVLIVLLMLLLAMTVLGMLSLRGALMEERMGAGRYDRSVAFQAAEAALREAEQRLMAPGVLADVPTDPDTCNNRFCASPTTAEGKPDR